MRGAIVTIHAVHGAVFAGFQLFGRGFGIRGSVDHFLAGIVEISDLGNHLALAVGGDVLNPGFYIEVTTVNADRTLPGTPADFEQEHSRGWRILLVV